MCDVTKRVDTASADFSPLSKYQQDNIYSPSLSRHITCSFALYQLSKDITSSSRRSGAHCARDTSFKDARAPCRIIDTNEHIQTMRVRY